MASIASLAYIPAVSTIEVELANSASIVVDLTDTRMAVCLLSAALSVVAALASVRVVLVSAA